MLHLGTRELNAALPPAAAWWRELARRFLTQLCHTAGLEQAQELAALPPPAEADLAALAETAPPMRGGEYLSAEVLARLWRSLDELVRAEIARHPAGRRRVVEGKPSAVADGGTGDVSPGGE